MTEINEDIAFEESMESADIIIFGAPFDGTVSYRPGARFGPDAIISQLYGIETFSPLLKEDLNDCHIYNDGSLSLPFGNTERVLDIIYKKTSEIITAGKKPLMLGGEHLVSYGVVKALKALYDDLYILHFDAHADLREGYMGESLSHASVMRRIHDMLRDEKIYQFGIRSCTKAEYEFANRHTVTRFFDIEGIEEVCSKLKNKNVYVTIDLDVLDPSILSGTGTPEAGGITYKEFERVILALKDINIVGADIVELAPNYDMSGVSTAVACKITREMLLCMAKSL